MGPSRGGARIRGVIEVLTTSSVRPARAGSHARRWKNTAQSWRSRAAATAALAWAAPACLAQVLPVS
ncbi:MAG TPA: hypothetical protein VNO17_04845 [Actinomycetota bacterium]|nr:hypothetical protein [Actinomycetota bacterium]